MASTEIIRPQVHERTEAETPEPELDQLPPESVEALRSQFEEAKNLWQHAEREIEDEQQGNEEQLLTFEKHKRAIEKMAKDKMSEFNFFGEGDDAAQGVALATLPLGTIGFIVGGVITGHPLESGLAGAAAGAGAILIAYYVTRFKKFRRINAIKRRALKDLAEQTINNVGQQFKEYDAKHKRHIN
jgi:hypothetical protein